MPKKPAKKSPTRKKPTKSFSAVLDATGLSQLKPIKPTRKAPAAPAKAKAKTRGK
jgi:hypothetical protein